MSKNINNILKASITTLVIITMVFSTVNAKLDVKSEDEIETEMQEEKESFTHHFIPEWNLFGTPFETTLGDLVFDFNGTQYSFEEAASQDLIYGKIYTYNINGYEPLIPPSDVLHPGIGYILKVYEEIDCIISGYASEEKQPFLLFCSWHWLTYRVHTKECLKQPVANLF